MLVLHDPILIALSVGIAILGSYTGLHLAAGIGAAAGAQRKAVLTATCWSTRTSWRGAARSG